MTTKQEYDEAVAYYSQFKYALFPDLRHFTDKSGKGFMKDAESQEFKRRIIEYYDATYEREPHRDSIVHLGAGISKMYFTARNEDLFDSITADLENILRAVLGRSDIGIRTERHKILD